MRAISSTTGVTYRFFAARHGESLDNERNTFGQNVGLTGRGIEEAEKLGAELRGRVKRLLFSPCLRAKETAEVIQRTADLEIVECKGLAARSWGDLMGCPSSEGASWKAEHRGIADRPVGGESELEMQGRIFPELNRIVNTYGEDAFGIVAHKGVLRVLKLLIDGELVPSIDFQRGQLYVFQAPASMFAFADLTSVVTCPNPAPILLP